MYDLNVALCIATRNRPDDLSECLRAAARSSIPLKEIIVSDDSTDTRTRELVHSQFPHVKFLEGPRKGLGPNRNNIIPAATSEWLLFMDDDARIGVDFLEKMTPRVSAGRGQNIIYSGVEVKQGELIIPRDLDFLGYQTRLYGPEDPVNTLVIDATLFPASLCRELLFDPRLIYGYEEVDIALRARAAGWTIQLCPDAFIYHYPSMVGRENYKPNCEAARTFVVFKHYYTGQKKRVKACIFLGASLVHNLAHYVKSYGLRGVPRSLSVQRKVITQIADWAWEPKKATQGFGLPSTVAGRGMTKAFFDE